MRTTSARADAALLFGLPAGVALLGQLDVWAPALTDATIEGSKPVTAAAFLVAAVVLVWRRRAPLAVFACVTVVLSALAITVGSSESSGAFLPLAVGVYAVARYLPGRVGRCSCFRFPWRPLRCMTCTTPS